MPLPENTLEKNKVHVYDPRTHRIWRVPASALPSDMTPVSHPGVPGDLWIDLDPVLYEEARRAEGEELKGWVKALPMVALTLFGVFGAFCACIAASNAFFTGRDIPVLPQESGMVGLLISAGLIGVLAYLRQRSHLKAHTAHVGHRTPTAHR